MWLFFLSKSLLDTTKNLHQLSMFLNFPFIFSISLCLHSIIWDIYLILSSWSQNDMPFYLFNLWIKFLYYGSHKFPRKQCLSLISILLWLASFLFLLTTFFKIVNIVYIKKIINKTYMYNFTRQTKLNSTSMPEAPKQLLSSPFRKTLSWHLW